MSTVVVEKVSDLDLEQLPVFAEVAKTFEKIQERAFSLFEQRGGLPGREWEDWMLAQYNVLGGASAELSDGDKEVRLRMAVPGVEPNNVKVTVTPQTFVVQADAPNGRSLPNSEIRFCEFSHQKLCRQFGLPSPIDLSKVSASLDKGILEVTAVKAKGSVQNESFKTGH